MGTIGPDPFQQKRAVPNSSVLGDGMLMEQMLTIPLSILSLYILYIVLHMELKALSCFQLVTCFHFSCTWVTHRQKV